MHEASNLTNCGSPVEKRGGSSKCQGNEGTISIVYIETLKLNLIEIPVRANPLGREVD